MNYFYCEYCGLKETSVRNLVAMTCNKHPLGMDKGKHKLYEGSEKTRYTCKYCGFQIDTIRNLVNLPCLYHPNGANKGGHSPAL